MAVLVNVGVLDTSQGAKDILGHTDFFINNAEAQPGCPIDQTSYDVLGVTRAMLNEGETMPGCSHKRAYKYYIESLEIEECTFLGIKCQSYADFRQVSRELSLRVVLGHETNIFRANAPHAAITAGPLD